jgi:hypothetical protein
MVTEFLSSLKFFIFIFSILIILKHLYNVIKVFTLQTGKLETSKAELIVLGCAISYIITIIKNAL